MFWTILVPIPLDHERDVAAALASGGAATTAPTVVEAVRAQVLAECPESMWSAPRKPRPSR